jgi:hypothetical protein
VLRRGRPERGLYGNSAFSGESGNRFAAEMR